MPHVTRTMVAASALALLVLTACGSAKDTVDAGASSSDSTPAPVAPPERGSIKAVGPDSATLDFKNSDIVPFLERFKIPESALGVTAPNSIDQAIDYSTAVVVAKIDDIVDEGRFETEPGSGETLQRLGIVLKPIKVLRGQLQPELTSIVIGRLETPEVVKNLAEANPPKGAAIFFLRWAGAYPHPNIPDDEPTEYERTHYIWTHITTVYAQGGNHVLSPMASESQKAGRAGMTSAREAAAYANLSGFTDRVRNSNSKLRRPPGCDLPSLVPIPANC